MENTNTHIQRTQGQTNSLTNMQAKRERKREDRRWGREKKTKKGKEKDRKRCRGRGKMRFDGEAAGDVGNTKSRDDERKNNKEKIEHCAKKRQKPLLPSTCKCCLLRHHLRAKMRERVCACVCARECVCLSLPPTACVSLDS